MRRRGTCGRLSLGEDAGEGERAERMGGDEGCVLQCCKIASEDLTRLTDTKREALKSLRPPHRATSLPLPLLSLQRLSNATTWLFLQTLSFLFYLTMKKREGEQENKEVTEELFPG